MRSGERERESRSCCNLEPTLSLSSLCQSLSAIAGRPALRALPLYILPSSWLFLRTLNTGMLILQKNQEFVWKGNSQLKVIRVSFQTCVALKIRGSCRQLSSFMILITAPSKVLPSATCREYDGSQNSKPSSPNGNILSGGHKAFGYLSTIKLTLKGDSRRNGRF